MNVPPISRAICLLASLLLGGCASLQRAVWVDEEPPRRINAVTLALPERNELPPVAGEMQTHRIIEKETLLDVARDAGLGFQEIKAANPDVDEWIPPEGGRVIVPTRWILPRSRYRGVVINIPEMRLYLFPADARPGDLVTVQTWAVGIGMEEAPSPVGPFTVRSKDENPTWGVPDSIYAKMENPRRVVPPGPDNPLGKYRIRLSKGLYAIHGTNNPWSIGRQTTHGCIRLYPEDIEALYPQVDKGLPGELIYQPIKVGEDAGAVYVEAHADVYGRIRDMEKHALEMVRDAGVAGRVDVERLRQAVRERRGYPVDVTRDVSAPHRAASRWASVRP